jgi:XTP/dITP diphosphohydrolase
MQKLILATRNPGKVREIKILLAEFPLEIESLITLDGLPEVIEDGETLEENALIKARTIYSITKIPTLADDTGLEVYHLDMAPGVISARYAGNNATYADNNKKLLEALNGAAENQRCAQFRCIAAFVNSETEKTVEGVCKGMILSKMRGSEGFGYDPLFVPEGYNKTYAQLTLVEKNIISHRAKAFQKMKLFLYDYFNLSGKQ